MPQPKTKKRSLGAVSALISRTVKNHLMILTQILVRPCAPCTIDCFYYGAQIERLFNWFGKTNFCVRSRAAAAVLSSLRPSFPSSSSVFPGAIHLAHSVKSRRVRCRHVLQDVFQPFMSQKST